MKCNKCAALFLAVLLTAGLLTGCGTTVVVLQEAPQTAGPAPAPNPSADGTAVRTGLSFVTDTTAGRDAAAGEDGTAQADISLVAVTVDDSGVIDSCVIDGVQATVGFSAEGRLTGEIGEPIRSKNELGADYGMENASAIGREWKEQAAALAAYVVGMTLEEVKGIRITGDGRAADADLASSVAIRLGDLLAGVEDAVANAVHLGAQKGDRLVLNTATTASESSSAADGEEGLARIACTVNVLTLRDGVITGCLLDAVEAEVRFDSTGIILGVQSDDVPSKNTLGDSYGMHAYSSIGADWHTQAAAFSRYVTGKTVAEATGIAVTEGKAADADLASSVTMEIGDFLELIGKAG